MLRGCGSPASGDVARARLACEAVMLRGRGSLASVGVARARLAGER